MFPTREVLSRHRDSAPPRLRVSLTLLTLLALTLGSSLSAQPAPVRPWNEDVLYFAITDRFHDGDPSNNVPTGSDPSLYDSAQQDIDRYHGGDFRGVEIALRDDYFKELGVTALWLTPPVRNAWYAAFDFPNDKTGYHGYWTQDFLDIDPHLVSSQSLDGARTYPDTRDGRMEHYRDLVDLAHSQGIKVIQDIVINHAGPVFYYDEDQDDTFDLAEREEWIQPFNPDGSHENARWADVPKWNLHRTEPARSTTVLDHEIALSGVLGDLSSYGRRGMSTDSLGASNGEEIECDFFALRTLDTSPESPHFDRLVDDYVEIYAFYVEVIGVDGFRIDTVKHVHHAFWDAFTERLRRRLGPERASRLILFGEVYDGDPRKIGDWTYREDWPEDRRPSLDSVLNFPFCFALREYLRHPGRDFGTGEDLDAAFQTLTSESDGERPFYNPNPGFDGLNSDQKIINFFENHDGLNRFRARRITARRNLLANALLLLAPGIPCLYYGTEADLPDRDGRIDTDGETGRLTFIPRDERERFEAIRTEPDFRTLAAITKLRANAPALQSATVSTLWVDNESTPGDDGIFAFARGPAPEPLIVVANVANRPRIAGVPGPGLQVVSDDGKPLLQRGARLEPVQIPGLNTEAAEAISINWIDGTPFATIPVGPETITIYRVVPERSDESDAPASLP